MAGRSQLVAADNSRIWCHARRDCVEEVHIRMGRWPDNSRSTLITFLMIFLLFPLLAWLCVWFMRG